MKYKDKCDGLSEVFLKWNEVTTSSMFLFDHV